jgi:hypothetical protein
MSPKRYLVLRCMQLAPRALRAAVPEAATVTDLRCAIACGGSAASPASIGRHLARPLPLRCCRKCIARRSSDPEDLPRR